MRQHSLERLKELLQDYQYFPDTGKFIGKRGREIGTCMRPDGYLVIDIGRVIYKAHRIAWF